MGNPVGIGGYADHLPRRIDAVSVAPGSARGPAKFDKCGAIPTHRLELPPTEQNPRDLPGVIDIKSASLSEIHRRRAIPKHRPAAPPTESDSHSLSDIVQPLREGAGRTADRPIEIGRNGAIPYHRLLSAI